MLKNYFSKIKNIIKKRFLKNNPPYLIQNKGSVISGISNYHNGNFIVQGSQEVKIGCYCAFGENIRIITESHDYNYPSIQYVFHSHHFRKKHPGILKFPPNKERTKGAVEIGNDVWIGHNVTIFSGVKIGNGACLGNGCIVTKDVEAYSIVGGVPAKLIKMRFKEDIITYLQEIQWWNWDKNKIELNEKFFYSNLNLMTVDELKTIII